jgi:uncharacterized membrane protein
MSQPADGAASKPGSQRSWSGLLLASLALNLLLLGTLGGHYWAARHWDDSSKLRGVYGLPAFAETLPPDRRKMVEDLIAAREQRLKSLREEVGRVRRTAGDAMAAEPFDKAKLDQALEAVVDIDSKYKRASLAILSETAEKFTPEERQAYRELRDKRRAEREARRKERKDKD